MLKKFFIFLISIILMIGMCVNVNATELKTSFDVIQKASETKYLENDQGYISKTIVDSNSDTGEVTIELKLSNTAKDKEQTQKYDNTEVYLLVSENIANNEESFQKHFNNITTLTKKIFDTSSKTKIGIVGIKGTISDSKLDENGKMTWGPKDESDVNGSESNAEVVIKATSNQSDIQKSLKNMNSSHEEYRTNLQAAIRLANKSYSKDTNKILISLYDDVPNIAIGVCSTITYGGLFSDYSNVKDAVTAKYEKVSTNTQNEILKLKESNISFILLRPGNTSYDDTYYNTETGEKTLDFDGSPYVEKIYGTMDKPTYGKTYSFDSNNIDTIITENIYQDVKELIQSDIKSVKIVDYFPEDITDNFEFSYVGNPSIGTTTEKIDPESKIITWDVGTLKGDEVATLKYKLKIKDMKNSELLNKTIATNEKVVLTYKDTEAKDYTVTLTSSPKVQLTEVKEIKKEENEKDDTIAKENFPQTGLNMFITIISIIAITLVGIFMYKKYNSYKDVK